jgi:hypothetical protein
MAFPQLEYLPPVTGPGEVGMGFVSRGAVTNGLFEKWRGKISQSATVCGGLVAPSYVRDNALPSARVLGVRYVRPMTGKRIGALEILAFLIAKPGESADDFYVDVICGSGQGVALMRAALAYARHNGFATASLSALPHVTGFYQQFGFLPGNGDPCRRGASAKRIAARGGGFNFGYRLRKCLLGTTAADNAVPRPDQGPYVLPPRNSPSTVTRQTGQTAHAANAINNGEVSSRAGPSPFIVKICRVVTLFARSGENYKQSVLKIGDAYVRVICMSSSAKFTVLVEPWDNVGQESKRASFRYDSSRTPATTVLGRVAEFPWLAELGPCIRDAAQRTKVDRGGNGGSSAARNARRVLAIARASMSAAARS